MTSRREFVISSGVVLLGHRRLAIASPPAHPPYDLVVRGGTVFDGSGTAGVEADVAITGDRIAVVAPRISQTGTTEIDAKGMAVAPGFIDIHSHADGTMFDDPRSESVVRQGVTTVVVGVDGSSRAPRAAKGDSSDRTFATVGQLFTAVKQLPPAINVASMVGLGTVRGIVVGEDDRPATPAELARMRKLVDQALVAGACGVSSGLEYTPGAFAPLTELVALCGPAAARGLPYATHMRNEDDRLLDAVDEAIAVAKGARCPLQISHLKTQGPRNWSKIETVLARLDREKSAGMDLAFDRYPYVAYQTGLTNLFPVWSRDGGSDRFLGRLTDSAVAPRIRQEALAKVDLIGGWDNVMISGVPGEDDKNAEGQRLGQYASSKGVEPYEAAIGLLRRNRADVGMVGFAMSEENLDRFLAHPLGMVCSDGGGFAIDGVARRGHPHPRGLGTFPRVLARYVRERKALKLEQAVHKMTGFPASRVKLKDRGRLAPGMAADVVVFDPATVADRATFAEPFQYPVGIEAVVVNGRIALRAGQRGQDRAGRALNAAATPPAGPPR